jgi:hypothetical protein
MPLGRLSARIDDGKDTHHLWLNNGTWWVHYTLNFDFRTRRIRRSLGTKSLAEAIRKRDALFERLATEGEWVPERGEEVAMPPLVSAAYPMRSSPSPMNPVRRPLCC